jgi:hypothetical protein
MESAPLDRLARAQELNPLPEGCACAYGLTERPEAVEFRWNPECTVHNVRENKKGG